MGKAVSAKASRVSGLQHRHTLASARSIHCPYMTEASLEKREVSLSLHASPPQFDLYSLGIHRPDLLPRASLEALLQNPHPAPLSKKRESVVEQGARMSSRWIMFRTTCWPYWAETIDLRAGLGERKGWEGGGERRW
jgi:hypothetical protein